MAETKKDPTLGWESKGIKNQEDKRAAYLDNKDKENWEEDPYPHNDVEVYKSGHLFEFDNSKGKERIHLMHCSGSGFEILKDGCHLRHTVGNEYRYNKGGITESIQRGRDTKIKGYDRTNGKGGHQEFAEDRSITTGRHSAEAVFGNKTTAVKGRMAQVAEGGLHLNVGSGSEAKMRITIDKDHLYITSPGNITFEAKKDINFKTGGKMTTECGDDLVLQTDSTMKITFQDHKQNKPWNQGAAFAPPGPGKMKIHNKTNYHDANKAPEKGLSMPNYG